MSTGRRILKNTGALTLARGVTAVLTLITLAYLGRVLGPDRFGILGVGTALVAYFALPVNLGLNVYGARELARDHSRMGELVGHILALRLVVFAVVLAAYLGTVGLLDKPPLFKAVLVVQGAILFAYAITLEWVFQGIERMGILAVRNVAASVLALGVAVLLVRGPDDVVLAAVATATALVLANAWLVLTYRREFGAVRLRADPAVWRQMLRPGLPIMASLFMISIYTNMDQLMLGLIRSEEEAGWYAAGYRLLTAALIPSDILFQAFLPALSGAAASRALRRTRGRAFVTAVLAIGLPVALGSWALAEWLIVLVFEEAYRPATGVFRLLMLNAAVAYATIAFGYPLLSWDRERPYTIALGAGAALNVVLNFALIPSYGMIGAALATLACQGIILLGVGVLHARATGTIHAAVVLRIIAATAVGVGGPVLAGHVLAWPPLALIAAALVAYPLAVIGFGAVDVQRLRTLLSRPPPADAPTAE